MSRDGHHAGARRHGDGEFPALASNKGGGIIQRFHQYLLVGGMCLVMGVVPVGATTFTVTNTNDSGAGSLRQAILDANANAGSMNAYHSSFESSRPSLASWMCSAPVGNGVTRAATRKTCARNSRRRSAGCHLGEAPEGLEYCCRFKSTLESFVLGRVS